MLALLVALLLVPARVGAAEPRATAKVPVKSQVSREDDQDDDDDDDDDDSGAAVSGAKSGATSDVADDDDDDDDDDDVRDPTNITANVALTSNYLLRGLTQTENQPALQGGFDWYHPLGFDLGAWGTNVRYPESAASIELDFSGGYSRELYKELSVRLGGLYYWYQADSSRNSWEVEASADWRGFRLEVDLSPSWAGIDQQSWYFNAGWSDEVIWGITPGAFVGYTLYPVGSFFPSYFDFKVSLAREFLGLTWEAAGVFTKVQSLLQTERIVDPEDEELTITKTAPVVYGGSRAVFTVSKTF